MANPLDESPQYIKGVGPVRAELLKRLGVETVRDLLYLFPRDHQDRTQIVEIMDLRHDQTATVKGEITSCRQRPMRSRQKLLTVIIADRTASMEAVWFNQPYLAAQFENGGVIYMRGKAQERRGRMQMVNPEFELIPPFDAEEAEADAQAESEFLGIVPVYPLTEGLRQFHLRRILKNALEAWADKADEVIPASLLDSRRLPGVAQALRDAHFPRSMEAKDAAHRRFVYEEFLLLECAMSMRRAAIQREPCPFQIEVTDEIDRRIRKRIPFNFTADQSKAVAEIVADLAKPHPMNRLLQGDVGSGKTVVALYAVLSAVARRMQTAVMAPTEILATQHYNTFREYLRDSKVRMELLVGGMSASQRSDARERIAAGKVDIVFGTHALIEEGVEFRRLALLVVDEQHKFGVVQRAKLREKGTHPHCLVMTATPIPRTLMLSVFGDLDVSTIEHMPPGRVPIETHRVAPGQIDRAFKLIRREVAAGRQAYIVYPLVEESDELELKAAVAMHEQLQQGEFRDLRVGLLTGRMSADDKDRVMHEFRDRKIHVLVATVVVEVGVDVPNATVMVIENAERFGLSQLHQLRGRIGRSKFKSWCIAVAAPKTEEAKARIKVFVECSDGFRLAEEDLKLRGPGEFFGTRQHGLPELKVGNIVEDYDLLKLAAGDARALIAEDPNLEAKGFRTLRRQVLDRFGETLELVDVG